MKKLILILLSLWLMGVGCGGGSNKSIIIEETITIDGTVLDSNEFQLAGARVVLTPEPNSSSNQGKTAITDKQGEFTVEVQKGQYNFEVFIDDTSCYQASIDCENGATKTVTLNTSHSLFSVVSSQYAIVDDYEPESSLGRDWYYSRIGTDRGIMGDGDYSVEMGGGTTDVTVNNGWGGVWTSLKYLNSTNDD